MQSGSDKPKLVAFRVLESEHSEAKAKVGRERTTLQAVLYRLFRDWLRGRKAA